MIMSDSGECSGSDRERTESESVPNSDPSLQSEGYSRTLQKRTGNNASSKDETSGSEGEGDSTGGKLECAICLQTCIHPVRLPCRHIFCFLCVKGIANQGKRCAMCRQEIPADFLDHPDLVLAEEFEADVVFEDGYQWFYEGRDGWWQYDERTSVELESALKRGDTRCEVLVAGFLYIIDFEHMIQMRRSDPSRRRKIKRDLATIPKKGVAGIRIPSTHPSLPSTPPAMDHTTSDTEAERSMVHLMPGAWGETGRAVDVSVAVARVQQAQDGILPRQNSKSASPIPATPTNTPQTPGESPGNQSVDSSAPSSPGRFTYVDSVDDSLAEAVDLLHIDSNISTLVFPSQRTQRHFRRTQPREPGIAMLEKDEI